MPSWNGANRSAVYRLHHTGDQITYPFPTNCTKPAFSATGIVQPPNDEIFPKVRNEVFPKDLDNHFPTDLDEILPTDLIDIFPKDLDERFLKDLDEIFPKDLDDILPKGSLTRSFRRV